MTLPEFCEAYSTSMVVFLLFNIVNMMVSFFGSLASAAWSDETSTNISSTSTPDLSDVMPDMLAFFDLRSAITAVLMRLLVILRVLWFISSISRPAVIAHHVARQSGRTAADGGET